MAVAYDADLDPPGPPIGFPFDPKSETDREAWDMACPNLYVDGIPWSRSRYCLGLSPDGDTLAMFATEIGRRVLADGEPHPTGDPEDTERVFMAYKALRRRLVSGAS